MYLIRALADYQGEQQNTTFRNSDHYHTISCMIMIGILLFEPNFQPLVYTGCLESCIKKESRESKSTSDGGEERVYEKMDDIDDNMYTFCSSIKCLWKRGG